jgi:uncharacterized protein (TIGR03067 family)
MPFRMTTPRTLSCLILAVLAFLCAGSGPSHFDDRLRNDHAAIQGEWAIVTMETRGQRLNKDQLPPASFTFFNDCLFIGGDGVSPRGSTWEARFDLNSRTSPSIMTIRTYRQNQFTGQTAWIYRIHGDSLQICCAPTRTPPKAFSTSFADMQTLYTFTRVTR